MTMMSRTSSESSLEEQSTVSSKSSKGTRNSRKSSDSTTVSGENRRRRGNRPLNNDDLDDMPSLSSFRQEDMSFRADDNMSLPSLSSIRIDDLSMTSSYHSSNHLNESGSAEGWGSFTSGGASNEDGESSEFSASSHSPTPPPGRGDIIVQRSGGLNMPTRSTSPVTTSPRGSVPVSMPQRSRSPVSEDSVGVASDSGDGSGSSDRAGNVLVPARSEPSSCSALPTMPARSSSPPRENGGGAQFDDASTSGKGGPVIPVAVKAPPPTSILKVPLERSGSFPLPSGTQNTIGAGAGPGGSSSSLKGVDSLPRLPRRTSTMDEDKTLLKEIRGSDGTGGDEADQQIADDEADQQIDVGESNQQIQNNNSTVQQPDPSDVTSVTTASKNPRAIQTPIPTKSSSTEETASATEISGSEDENGNHEQKKKGIVKQFVKKAIGKASSFKGPMKMIGKTASKLKLVGARRENGEKQTIDSPDRSPKKVRSKDR